jgi:hypothetical protein
MDVVPPVGAADVVRAAGVVGAVDVWTGAVETVVDVGTVGAAASPVDVRVSASPVDVRVSASPVDVKVSALLPIDRSAQL